MMDFRARLEQSKSRPVSDEATDSNPSAEMDAPFSCPYFAVDRGRAPSCLELRLRDGVRKALPYAFFTEITFEQDCGIAIFTSLKKIRITGRNLLPLFEQLVLYRVRFIQADVGGDGNEDGLFVGEIMEMGP
jgi:hypothetical protein